MIGKDLENYLGRSGVEKPRFEVTLARWDILTPGFLLLTPVFQTNEAGIFMMRKDLKNSIGNRARSYTGIKNSAGFLSVLAPDF